MVLGLALGFACGGVAAGKVPQFTEQGQQGPAARGRQFLLDGRLQFGKAVFQQFAGIDARCGVSSPIPLPSPALGNRGFLEQTVSFRRNGVHLGQAAGHGDDILRMPVQGILGAQLGIAAKPFQFANFRRQLPGGRVDRGSYTFLFLSGKGRSFQQIVVLMKLKGYSAQLGQVQLQREGHSQRFL